MGQGAVEMMYRFAFDLLRDSQKGRGGRRNFGDGSRNEVEESIFTTLGDVVVECRQLRGRDQIGTRAGEQDMEVVRVHEGTYGAYGGCRTGGKENVVAVARAALPANSKSITVDALKGDRSTRSVLHHSGERGQALYAWKHHCQQPFLTIARMQ